MVRNAVTTTGCLKKPLAAKHGLLRHDTVLSGTLSTNTAPVDRKHVRICYATNHLADCSEYRTMNVTWRKRPQTVQTLVVFTFYCYGVLSDKPNYALRNVSKTICHHLEFINIHSYVRCNCTLAICRSLDVTLAIERHCAQQQTVLQLEHVILNGGKSGDTKEML